MSAYSNLDRVNRLVSRLAACSFSDPPDQAIAGYAIGVAYSLQRAFSLGWVDGMGSCAGTERESELKAVAKDLRGQNTPTQPRWLAGYYYGSAILRLPPLGEAIGGRNSGAKWDLQRSIRLDVNALKHGLSTMLSIGLKSTVEDALEALTMVVGTLELLAGQKIKHS